MNFEPEKFFIGLLDFFSVLLPGALFTYLLLGDLKPKDLGGNACQELTGTAGWAAFLVGSYLSGHLVFLFGSWLDRLYDKFQRHALGAQLSRPGRWDRLSPWFARLLVWAVFKPGASLTLNSAKVIKQRSLDPLLAHASINTFQWSKALLALESPASLATVQRFEADSKFFRSFAIVLLALFVMWLVKGRPGLAALGAFLILAALWRYMEQRFKAINQAYWSVITHTARTGNAAPAGLMPAAALATHGGGLVYRMRQSQAEYLLVEGRDDPQQWVLPTGRVALQEQPHKTAVRAVHTETGVWATIRADMGQVSHPIQDGPAIVVQFFLMESAGPGSQLDLGRKHVWLPLGATITERIHPETRELLQAAAPLVRALPRPRPVQAT
jgi:ADP-ribose pyrophosphatase YjhB (NUDIX family)